MTSRKSQPKTLRGCMAAAVIRALVIMVCGLIGYGVGVAVFKTDGITNMIWANQPERVQYGPTAPTPYEYAVALSEENGCYLDGNHPTDRIPAHALVTAEGEKWAQIVPSEVGFGIWLDGNPGTLHAFCP